MGQIFYLVSVGDTVELWCDPHLAIMRADNLRASTPGRPVTIKPLSPQGEGAQ